MFKKAVRGVKRFLRFSVPILYQFLDFLVPKNRHLFVFSQTRGRYDDNTRWLFEYIQSVHNVQAFWLYQGDIHKLDTPFKSNIFPIYSLKGFLLSLRAKYYVISHGTGDMGFYKSRFKTVVHVCHGTAVKAIAFDLPNVDKKHLRREKKYYDKLIVASKIEAHYMSSAWKMPLDKMLILGLPRYDNFFTESQPFVLQALKLENKKIILYAPTFRENQETLFFPGIENYEKLIDILNAHNAVILVRPHINDSLAIKKLAQLNLLYPEEIRIFDKAAQGDINVILPFIDVMITDYSSIFIDILLKEIPIIFVPYDYELYTKERSFAYDYHLITPGPKVEGGDDLIIAIESALKEGLMEYRDHRNFVKKMFHQYQDGKNCERVFAGIMKNEQACL